MVPKFEFHGIKPAFINGGLRAFVQTVLPTIYDDSLSYYELLNKVVKHLNNVVADVATLNTNQEQFITVVTDFINRYGIETYDIEITNPLDPAQLQLSDDDTTALFEAIVNNKVVRVFVHNAATDTVYTCYYCTIDNSLVEPGVNKNDLYFAGYNFRQLETNATVIPWKIVKIERNGAITIYDNVNAVTKKYVDDSINTAAHEISRRIDSVVEKSPYRVMFDVYPDPDTPRQFIIATDITPVAIGMLYGEGRDIECYLVRKAAADGVVIETVKADSVVFGHSKIIITFDNTSGTDTIYKVGYNVISGDTATNEWSYQVSGKVCGRVEFNIATDENNNYRLASASHTPAEVYKLYQDYNGFVPCAVYFNVAITDGGETITSHVKTNAVVRITDTQHGYLINVDFNDITNGANALGIKHYLIQGFSETNGWNFSSFAYEYPTSLVLLNNLIPILRAGLYGTDQTSAIDALEIALGGEPEPENPVETYTPDMTDGYINVSTGAVGGTTTYKHTEIIHVREGDKVYGTSFDSTYNVTIPRIRARYTAAYDANGTIYPAGGTSDQHDYEEGTPFVVPAGVYGVVFSIVNSLANQVVVYVDKSERVGE